ncbi:MAG TPA: LON peptidase substrate-binding domain-containing protein [Gemmataceae bacterium]|nr:LON peptidase substrate-binding domain-containing protein [Gemmataceae bacterium]
MNDDRAAIQEFGGVARLFPLPGLVFFPTATQPLHIFEPRYRAMTADALASDRLIALVLLKEGWEEDYDNRPAVHRVAGLGRIVADQLLPDGRYNLILRGLARVRIDEELDCETLFRRARVSVLNDESTADVDELMGLRTALSDLMLPRVSEGPSREQLRSLFKGELPLGQLCDVLSFALPLRPEAKQELLETLVVPERARRLMEAFTAISGGPAAKPVGAGVGKRFPPDFSRN